MSNNEALLSPGPYIDNHSVANWPKMPRGKSPEALFNAMATLAWSRDLYMCCQLIFVPGKCIASRSGSVAWSEHHDWYAGDIIQCRTGYRAKQIGYRHRQSENFGYRNSENMMLLPINKTEQPQKFLSAFWPSQRSTTGESLALGNLCLFCTAVL